MRVLLTALELPPDGRARYLDETCAHDLTLRREVDRLLAADLAARDAFPTPADADVSEQTWSHPARVGPYRIIEQIGQGGMGRVYLAEQEHPVRRTVALKLIRPGMDTDEIVARFRSERQALALLEHPNIARVYDAGAVESTGRPYFAMELIKGWPITQFCDEHHLTTEHRLRLFIDVCHAVQHAHQKGIVHRDLKPSNVLVAECDEKPVVKVIDFGVAKAVGQQLDAKTMCMSYGQVIGTIEYMSPEHATLNRLDIDTRSDIYSLGVLLYELLTGEIPFDRRQFASAAFDELLRIIREEEPERPSTKLSRSRTRSSIALNRQTAPSKLTRQLRGELDWIVMRSLEKDRERRYQTANAFSADVQRYLNDEPVEAGPTSGRYRFEKFAQRHRAVLITAGALLVTVLAGLATSTFLIAQERDVARDAAARANRQHAEAERERQRAETNLRMAREATDKLFTNVAQQLANKPHMQQVRRRLLEDALEFHQSFLKQKGADPEVRQETARAYRRVGGIHEDLGNAAQAEAALRQAVALAEKLTAEFPEAPAYREDVALARDELAYRAMHGGQHREQAELARLVLADWQRLASDYPAVPSYQHRLAHAHTSFGNTLSRALGQYDEAERHFRLALETWKTVQAKFPDNSEDRFGPVHAHLWLGVHLLWYDFNRSAEAERELRQALDLCEQSVAEAPDAADRKGRLAHIQTYLGDLLGRMGKPLESVKLYQRAVEIREKLRDDFPDDKEHQRRLGHEYRALGRALHILGRTEEAEAALRQSVATCQKLVADHPGVDPHPGDLGWSYFNLGLLLHDAGRVHEAADAFRPARELSQMIARKFPDSGNPQYGLALFLATCPDPQFRDAQGAIEAAERFLQDFASSRGGWHLLGIARYRAGKWQDAIDALGEAMELGRGGDSAEWFFLAMAHWQLGDKQQASKWYDQAVRWMDEHRSGDPELRRCRAEAAGLLQIIDKPTTRSGS